VGQAVDEVEVDRLEPQISQLEEEVLHDGEGLVAVHRVLDLLVKVLDAQRDPVETELI
jgi:hypothetical protein